MSSSLACSRTYSSYVSVAAGVPADHPIRRLRILVDTILRELSDLLDTRYATLGGRRFHLSGFSGHRW